MNEHAPGWYEHAGERRYWDGQQWTHARSLPPAPPPGPPAPVVGVPGPVMPPPRRDPGLSLLLSFFIPGVGSMTNGDVGAGVAFLAAYISGLVLVVCLGWLLVGFIGLPISLAAWVWSMFHAYQGAVDRNRAMGYTY